MCDNRHAINKLCARSKSAVALDNFLRHIVLANIKVLMNNFIELGLSEQTVTRLDELGFTTPTEVQSKTISLLLSGRDLMASAQTGTGKTAAFALPIIEHLTGQLGKFRRIKALVLVPTRELALQVKTEFDRLGRHARLKTAVFHGGTGYGAQFAALKSGIDIAVATPGRLNDLLERNAINLSSVRFLVLDEADRMLDMGFAPQVRRIMAKMPDERQTMLFTATLDARVQKIAAEIMNEPVVVRCKQNEVEPKSISQFAHRVTKDKKDALLLSVLGEFEEATVLVFTRTKYTAERVTKRLKAANVGAEEIHGNISQNRRERTIAGYRAGRFNVLVATDIAARGLDIPAITHVVNYDLPDCAADYIHRIGRTGRAGRTGIAHSFVSDDQRHLARDIEKLIGRGLVRTDEEVQQALQPQRQRVTTAVRAENDTDFRRRRRRPGTRRFR
jgi:ATP-dependent RNA helicase RhlE